MIAGFADNGPHELLVGRFTADGGPAESTTIGKIACGPVATLAGTPKADRLMGLTADVIVALGGNDRIDGKGGKDLICAGNGNDVINAGGGRDRVLGGAGRTPSGAAPARTMLGNAARDQLFGGPGRDLCDGGAGRHDTAASSCERLNGCPRDG